MVFQGGCLTLVVAFINEDYWSHEENVLTNVYEEKMTGMCCLKTSYDDGGEY